MLDSVFEENFVSNIGSWVTGLLLFDGGGLVIYGTRVRVTVRSSNFSRNGAENGGAMALRGSYALEVEDCLVEENIAKTQGGGILLTVRRRVGAFCPFFIVSSIEKRGA